MPEWSKTLLSQIQVENTIAQVPGSNPAWDLHALLVTLLVWFKHRVFTSFTGNFESRRYKLLPDRCLISKGLSQ